MYHVASTPHLAINVLLYLITGVSFSYLIAGKNDYLIVDIFV